METIVLVIALEVFRVRSFFNAKNNCDLPHRALHLFFIILELTVGSDYSGEICNIPSYKFSFL